MGDREKIVVLSPSRPDVVSKSKPPDDLPSLRARAAATALCTIGSGVRYTVESHARVFLSLRMGQKKKNKQAVTGPCSLSIKESNAWRSMVAGHHLNKHRRAF